MCRWPVFNIALGVGLWIIELGRLLLDFAVFEVQNVSVIRNLLISDNSAICSAIMQRNPVFTEYFTDL